MKKLEFHPEAQKFPLMPLHERNELARDIKENGQRLPIVLVGGKIMDGRNRYLACIAAGIEPTVINIDVKDPKSFVASMNYFRRHLTTQERSHFGALLLLASENVSTGKVELASNDAIPEESVAKSLNVSRRSVQRAKKQIREKAAPKPVLNGKVVDILGTEITPESMPWWNRKPEVDGLQSKLRSAQLLINQLSENDAFWRDVGVSTLKANIKSMIHSIEHGSMSYVCPYCHGVKIDRCKECRNTGLMSRHAYDHCVPKEKKKHVPECPF